MRGTLLSMILEKNSGKGINMMQIVGELKFVIFGSPGWASIEELLSQLPEDMIGSGFKKKDPGRTSLLHSIYSEGVSPGASSKESVKQRCVLFLKQ
jgi:hypothetical protein